MSNRRPVMLYALLISSLAIILMLTFTGSGLCNLRRSCWMVLSPEFVRIETKTAIKIDSLGKLSTAATKLTAATHMTMSDGYSTLSYNGICHIP
ncbi:hypothetical protein L204_103488 [Cryptococcus depauperatus]